MCDEQGMPEKQAKGTSCHFSSLSGDPTQLSLVMEAGIAEADSLIIGGIEKEDAKEADTLLLSMLLVLQDALLRCPKRRHPLHVIGLVRTMSLSLFPGLSGQASILFLSCSFRAQTVFCMIAETA